jgi:hypothetical protein
VLKNPESRANYPHRLRRVRALVEVDGQQREMEFLTNNLSWSAPSVAELYRCRWQIEVFFKPIKQSLQLCDFLGDSANAVRWQVWTAGAVALRADAFPERDERLSITPLRGSSRSCGQRCGRKWIFGICCGSMGQQVDTSATWPPPKRPIFPALRKATVGQQQTTQKKIFLRERLNS